MLFKFHIGIVIFVALSLLAGHWLMQKAPGDRREPTQQEAAALAERKGPQLVPSAGQPAPTAPVELMISRAPMWTDLSWVPGLLFGDPETLWTRWLAWPVAVAMLFGSALAVFSAWANWLVGLVATAGGVSYLDGTGYLKQSSWQQVGTVRLMRYCGRRATQQGPNAPTSRVLERETLQLLDKAGASQRVVDAPLRPAFENSNSCTLYPNRPASR